jgi:alpha-beta hydrolase superfamily lysophospholipase
MRPAPLILFSVLAAGLAAPFAMVAFGTVSPPPPGNFTGPPDSPPGVVETYQARDGQHLAVRLFDATDATARREERIAILIHGSGSSSLYMSALANALASQGMTSYAPDWRGNGLSGRSGDIDHVGQLEEDLEDLLGFVERDHPGATFVLVGFSAGGSFSLRVADQPVGRHFTRIVALAPFLGRRDPSARPNHGEWAKPYVVRLVGLKMLHGVGVHALDGLPVVAFAVPKDIAPERGTPTWSYRLAENFNTSGGMSLFAPGRTWHDDIGSARTRLNIIYGDKDTVTDTARAKSEFASAFPDIPFTIVPDTDHADLVRRAPAVASIVRAVLGEVPAASLEDGVPR